MYQNSLKKVNSQNIAPESSSNFSEPGYLSLKLYGFLYEALPEAFFVYLSGLQRVLVTFGKLHWKMHLS